MDILLQHSCTRDVLRAITNLEIESGDIYHVDLCQLFTLSLNLSY